MNWNRAEFKEQAKLRFRRNYWPCVAVSVVLVLLGGGGSTMYNVASSNSGQGDIQDLYGELSGQDPALVWTVLGILFGALAVGGIISLVLRLLLCNPFEVGASRFYVENRGRATSFGAVGAGFSRNFGNVVLTEFLRDLFVVLWSLLFIIPGIVKSFAYFAVPYILAENPNPDHSRVLELSRNMTRGWKGEIFVTYLSFILWGLLSCITLGIVGVFYANPYLNATCAEMYAFLRQEALNNNIAWAEELPGFGGAEDAALPESL